ncbi:hypothetical protein CBW65_04475 [Tumebacillus avium]|uniref:DUF3888 domain-containing protein n=1 Tax=Tumebacillus avium TaxID=1903704 RepID=A0A1Y0IM33_9BACL|nr:DUF3888 domain-containing protein [Tumebacillus avium]ARU60404.1 hypothetical protein CBW65_04475 [Tumebacillus avium]
MKRKIAVLLFVCHLTGIFVPQQALSEYDHPKEEPCQEVLLTSLNPYISEATKQYYGEVRQYGLFDAKILDIQKDPEQSFNYKVRVQIKTFIGAHNPPEGLDTLTIHIDTSGGKVVNYEHRELPRHQ